MISAKSAGRLIGILLVLQISGLIVPFVMLLPLTAGPSEWLVRAAESSFQIKLAVFLLLANCALTIGITLAAFRTFRRHSYTAALMLTAVSVIMFTMQTVDNAHILSMVSLSRQYAQAGGQDELFRVLAGAVGSTRRWVHLTELLVIDTWIFSLYAILYRYGLVPRLLALFGMVTVILHLTGIPVPLFLGYQPVTFMGATMALSHITLAVWLIVKGFAEHSGSPADPGDD